MVFVLYGIIFYMKTTIFHFTAVYISVPFVKIQFASVSETVAVCIRSPAPMLIWSKERDSLPVSRYNIINYNTELTISNVKQSDEGDYKCQARNRNGEQQHIIHIDVQGQLLVLLFHY